MLQAKFDHFGVPTSEKRENETYIEGAKVYITSPDDHPFRVEFLRFEPGSPMAPEVCNGPHAAFFVNSLDEAIAGKKVIVEPFDVSAELRCAFIMDGEAVIEVMQKL